MVNYIPSHGDIVILNFDPQSGHEQKGRRPALVVSQQRFNARLGLAYVCPITSTKRDFPFHVEIKTDKVQGFVMSEQLRSVDFKSRKIKFIESAPEEILNEVLAIVDSIIN